MNSKLSSRHRTGQQDPSMVGLTPYGNRQPGPCGPVAPTVPQSWGAACPTGVCSAENLASSLNRQFAGERYPCREIAWWIEIALDAAGDGTFEGNARVTICPNRVTALSLTSADADENGLAAGLLTVFEIGNQNQIVGDPLPLNVIHPLGVAPIPFVTDCVKAGMPMRVVIDAGPANGHVYFAIIGPAIG